MIIDNTFEISEIVYLITDKEQIRRVVTSIKVCPDSSLMYQLSSGTTASDHYDFEISRTEDIEYKIKSDL